PGKRTMRDSRWPMPVEPQQLETGCVNIQGGPLSVRTLARVHQPESDANEPDRSAYLIGRNQVAAVFAIGNDPDASGARRNGHFLAVRLRESGHHSTMIKSIARANGCGGNSI